MSSIDLAVDDLNLQLSDLGVGLDAEHFTVEGVRPGGEQEDAFNTTFAVVLDRIGALEHTLHGSSPKNSVRETDSIEVARERGMPMPRGAIDASAIRIEALSFLCSELQLLCMEAHLMQQKGGGNGQKVSTTSSRSIVDANAEDERGHALEILSSLQSILQVSHAHGGKGDDLDSLMSSIAGRARTLVSPVASRESVSMSVDGDDRMANVTTSQPPRAMLEGVCLNDHQQEVTKRVNEALAADFGLRRRMLLRRCHVAVKSFLRGKDVEQGRDIVEQAQARMEALTVRDPSPITVNDALHAPESLAWEHSRKITTETGKGASVAKAVLMGDVPDRGGRVNQVRVGAPMPKWTERKELPPRHSGGRRDEAGNKGGGAGEE
ncbi:unnamed protein product, partial [Discosporangium mesarthrocarpum]